MTDSRKLPACFENNPENWFVRRVTFWVPENDGYEHDTYNGNCGCRPKRIGGNFFHSAQDGRLSPAVAWEDPESWPEGGK
jgi:hypothetical protein